MYWLLRTYPTFENSQAFETRVCCVQACVSDVRAEKCISHSLIIYPWVCHEKNATPPPPSDPQSQLLWSIWTRSNYFSVMLKYLDPLVQLFRVVLRYFDLLVQILQSSAEVFGPPVLLVYWHLLAVWNVNTTFNLALKCNNHPHTQKSNHLQTTATKPRGTRVK